VSLREDIQARLDYLQKENEEDGGMPIRSDVLAEFWRLFNLVGDDIIPGEITASPGGGLHFPLNRHKTQILIR